ncbi:Rv3235 family protein [Actinoplanes solisilvae]|uniref:Rv3235 family protein n=1 Tax=Actinoplanes solisilvae TaxID=2486853 RepID=UPI000FD92DF8|nr:Rv3235 family protein [Actinoplanes solisilvae]
MNSTLEATLTEAAPSRRPHRRKGPQTTVTLRPTPRCEPPFDDELEPIVWATAHQMALDWPAPAQRPTPAKPNDAPPAAIAGASADARLAVRCFVRTCVEVLNGHRPAAHLRRLSRPMEASEVVAQGTAAAHRVADLRKASHPGRRTPRRTAPVAVIRVVLCEPRPGAIEAAVALLTADRTWALALRLELHQESWRATALRLV